MPSLEFLCRSTTGHEVFEEWAVARGEAHRLKLEVFDWDKDLWVPHDPNDDVWNSLE
jgi:hypothetical protein